MTTDEKAANKLLDHCGFKVRRNPACSQEEIDRCTLICIEDAIIYGRKAEREKVLAILWSEDAAWTDIELRALSDKDRGRANQWGDWLEEKLKEIPRGWIKIPKGSLPKSG